MINPWLTIPAADYKIHMEHKSVRQSETQPHRAIDFLSASAAMRTVPLTLSHVEKQESLTVVVDFDSRLHTGVVDSIEHFWKTQGNVKDVTVLSTDVVSKSEDLAPGNVVLYGTFEIREDNPVFHAFRGTWIGELLRKEAPHFSGEVGGLVVGKNPFSEGSSVIVVATSLDLLPQLHEHYDGSKSFVSVVNGRLETVMIYDAGFNRIDPGIDLKLALEDMWYFFRVVEEAHPHPLMNISPEGYIDLKRNAQESLEKAADSRSIVTISALSVELAKAAAAFQDGHTNHYLDLQGGYSDTTRRMLPFKLSYQLGAFYADQLIENEHRRKIVAIANKDPFDFLQPILAAISGEKLDKKITSFVANQGVYWFYFAPIDEPRLALTTVDRTGETIEEMLDLVTMSTYQSSIVSTDKEERVEDFHEYYHNGDTCYYRFDSFRNSKKQKAYADDLFAEIRSNGTKNFIIDLRFNGGGNSAYGDYLLDCLTVKPYRFTARMDVKLSEHLYEQHEYYRAFDELTGQTITRRAGLRNPEDRGNRFEGNLYVLVGPKTFSSAGGLAAIVKDYELGTLIGEEVGATRQTFGENLHKRLPHSGLGFNVSCKQFFAPIPQFGDERRGTLPDIPINEQVFTTYPDSDDPVLSYALDHIASR
ncbi:MAG: S41 family peptidase [Gemmatimonadetes bacterium]|nr:S41 family peptidase [Gemmatimonadota bacterium]